MSNKNWKWYIDNDDLMGCYERFQNAPANWKNHWWSTIEEIFHSSKKWVKEYVLDPIQRTIVKLVKKIKNVTSSLGSYTYFIKIFDENGKWVYNKIGKGNDVIKRLNQQCGHTYKEGITFSSYEIIKAYKLPTDDLALVLESFMRNYFRKSYYYVPNDRFEPFSPTEEDLDIFEKYYNLVLTNA